MINEKELHNSLLRFGGDSGGHLGPHDHSIFHRHGARGLRLWKSSTVDLNIYQTLAAGADRCKQGMIAEAWNGYPKLLGRADNQGAFWNGYLNSINNCRNGLDRSYRLLGRHLSTCQFK